MGFSWSMLSEGEKIDWDIGVELQELRNNVDWLDDNLADASHDASVCSGHDASHYGSYNSGDLSSVDSTVNATADSSYHGSYDSGVDSSDYSGYCGGHNSTVHSSYYTSYDGADFSAAYK